MPLSFYCDSSLTQLSGPNESVNMICTFIVNILIFFNYKSDNKELQNFDNQKENGKNLPILPYSNTMTSVVLVYFFPALFLMHFINIVYRQFGSLLFTFATLSCAFFSILSTSYLTFLLIAECSVKQIQHHFLVLYYAIIFS